MNKVIPLMIMVIVSVFVSGCVFLMPYECRDADWRTIGMDDGSSGKMPSYVDNYRRACGRYNIAPDYQRYEEGRIQGARLFCTQERGFQLGKDGRPYDPVCPPNLVPEFLEGFEKGREVLAKYNEIYHISTLIDANKRKLTKLQVNLKNETLMFIKGEFTENKRSKYLRKMDLLTAEIYSLEKRVHDQERIREKLNGEYIAMKEAFYYWF